MSKLSDRLPGRTAAVVAALVLAVIASLALSDYVRGAQQQAVQDAGLVDVWVASRDIGIGVAKSDLLARVNGDPSSTYQNIKRVGVPTELVPAGAVTNPEQDIRDFVARPIQLNSILTTDMFAGTEPSSGFEVPPGQVAVSIDVEVTNAVANFIDPGDHINILVTLDGGTTDGPEGPVSAGSTTRHLLQDVTILEIGRRVTVGAVGFEDTVARDDGLLTLTLALDPIDAERLIFAQSSGSIYITLLPTRVGDFQPTTTTGRNAENLFTR